MEAETEASRIISNARADKKAKMVRAQIEAEAEIKKYQQIKEAEYEKIKLAKAGLDDSGQEMLAESEREVEGLKAGYAANKDACIEILGKAVSAGKF